MKSDYWKRVFKVAVYCGFKLETAYKWKQRGEVPKAHRYMMANLAKRSGTKLTLSEMDN